MTPSSRPGTPVSTPEQLRDLMGDDFTLSEEQWSAVSAPLAPAVVIAGAGSGKTALMAARVVFLVANGLVRPDEVLGLTFTTKATAELASRIRGALERAGLLPGGDAVAATSAEEAELLEPTVSTYNAYAASLLTEHGLRVGHEPDTRIVSDGARYQLAERAVASHRGSIRELSDHPPTVIENLLALEGELAEHLRSPEDVRRFDDRLLAETQAALDRGEGQPAACRAIVSTVARRRELLGLVEDYRALKLRLGLMDFSDQVALAARLALEHPAVGESERTRFRVVLLDEYQDTSVAQARMLAALFSGPDAERGLGHAVTAVGDPNQAIYGWRGASVSNILRFAEYFPPSDGAPLGFSLTVNRRSDERILEVANAVAAPLYAARDQVARLVAKPTAAPGEVRVRVHETAADELAWAAAAIKRAGTPRPRGGEGVPWREIGVLVRDNAHAAAVFDHLTALEVPVEIVGLKGLLRLPEVAEVVATLNLVQDLADNASLLTLLSGPRWAIGPRDLALLGRRARELVGHVGRPAHDDSPPGLVDRLDDAVAGSDPVDVPALVDALDDPGPAPFSDAARHRFAMLSAELRRLRAHAGEPLLELVRRVVDVIGIDVELASSHSPAAPARRDNLDTFVKAVADFTGLDGQASLVSLLAWIKVEEDGQGLDVATPGESDSVKLLTVHRSKGLEFDHVWLLGTCEQRFPNTTSRPTWTTSPKVLPHPLRGDHRDLPVLRAYDKQGLAEFDAARKAYQQTEELRLGYVALTRARHRMWVSSYVWTEGRKTPLGASPYQHVVAEVLAGHGLEPDLWVETPPKGTPNPLAAEPREYEWPVTVPTLEARRRQEAAERVRGLVADLPAGLVEGTVPVADALAGFADHETHLDLTESALVAEWDGELDRLVAEARDRESDTVVVPLPSHLSATALARLQDDPGAYARDLARPMPRRPSAEGRFGTRFHEWVESRSGQLGLLDAEEIDGRGDHFVDDLDDLAGLIDAFEAGPFADRAPVGVEAPFSLVLAGQVVRGRIDAVYAEPPAADGSPRWLLVDWKTSRAHDADPLQLAVYRVAWAELHGVPLSAVRAAFYYVRSGSLVEPPDLPDRDALQALVTGEAAATAAPVAGPTGRG